MFLPNRHQGGQAKARTRPPSPTPTAHSHTHLHDSGQCFRVTQAHGAVEGYGLVAGLWRIAARAGHVARHGGAGAGAGSGGGG